MRNDAGASIHCRDMRASSASTLRRCARYGSRDAARLREVPAGSASGRLGTPDVVRMTPEKSSCMRAVASVAPASASSKENRRATRNCSSASARSPKKVHSSTRA